MAGSDHDVLSTNGSDCALLMIIEFEPLLTPEGLRRVKEFIPSLNVYGNTPFLYPIYGGGDVLQSFCRINNVYAGITMLQTDVVGVVMKEEKVIGVEIVNESVHTVIRCKNVIAADEYPMAFGGKEVAKKEVAKKEGKVIHGVYIVRGDDKGEVEGEKKKDLREIVVIPATEEHRAIYILVVMASSLR